jgi:hypothetical protein
VIPFGVWMRRNPSYDSRISTSSPRSRRPNSTERTASGFELTLTLRYPILTRSAPFAGGVGKTRGALGAAAGAVGGAADATERLSACSGAGAVIRAATGLCGSAAGTSTPDHESSSSCRRRTRNRKNHAPPAVAVNQTIKGFVTPPMRPLASTLTPPKPEPPKPEPVPPPAGGGVGDAVGVAVGSDDGAGLAVVGSGVGSSVGVGESIDPGPAVGFGVALLGFRLGLGVGFGVGFGVALAVGFGVGFAVGFGVGLGGAVTTTEAGTTALKLQLVPPLMPTTKLYGHVPAGSFRVPLNTTPALMFVPAPDRLLVVPLTRTRTHDGAVPDLSETVTVNLKLVAVVPVPGETAPGPIVTVAHDLAATGDTKPTRGATNQLVSARAPTRLIQVRRRSIPRNHVSVWWNGR